MIKKLLLPVLGFLILIIVVPPVHAKEKHPHEDLSVLMTQDDSVVLSMVNPNLLVKGQKNTFVHFQLIELDLDKSKFIKKSKVRIGHEFSNRAKFSYKYDETFKEQYIIGHLSEGHYAIVSMETSRFFKNNAESRSVKCFSNIAPVYHFKPGQAYFLNDANTVRLRSNNESLNQITSFVSAQIGKPIQFTAATPIGYISFKASGKNIIGEKIRCPEGKKFTYVNGTAANLDK